MWRRFRFVMMLLVLGAVVNVVVAWGAMVLGKDDLQACARYSVWEPRQERVVWVHRFGYEVVGFLPAPATIVETKYAAEYLESYPGTVWWDEIAAAPHRLTWAGGWPMLSVMAWGDGPGEGPTRSVRGGVQWTPPQRWPDWLHGQQLTQGPTMVLPIRPIWAGFLVNTLIYTTVIWLLLATFTMRSRVRAWRGQCVRCGYPRGESSTCSECGAAVKPLATTAPPHAAPPSS